MLQFLAPSDQAAKAIRIFGSDRANFTELTTQCTGGAHVHAIAKRSIFRLVSVQQVSVTLDEQGMQATPNSIEFVKNKFRRVQSTQCVEGAFNRQKTLLSL